MHHPELTQTTEWTPSTCLLFVKSLERYIDKLKPKARKDTTKINNAIKHSESLVDSIQKQVADAGEVEMMQLRIQWKDLAIIHSLLARYFSWKKQLLRESKEIPEAIEPEQEEVEETRRILSVLEEMRVARGEVIKIPFYGESEEKKNKIGSQVINIGTLNNMNSQFAGFNSGNMVQVREIKIVETLNLLSEVIDKKAPEGIKQEALADILTLNAQIAGGKPDKSIMKKTFDKLKAVLKKSLTYGAAFAQIYQVAIEPHLAKIQTFVNSISH